MNESRKTKAGVVLPESDPISVLRSTVVSPASIQIPSPSSNSLIHDYQRLFEIAGDAILIFDGGTEAILDANSAACRVYGYSREQLLASTLDLIQPPERRGWEKTQEIIAATRDGGVEVEHRRADGTPVHVEIHATEVTWRGSPAVMSINREVTEGKRTEQARLESEERYRSLVEKATDGIFVKLDDRFAYVNPATVRMLGARRADDLLGRAVLDFVHSEDHARFHDRVCGLGPASALEHPLPQRFIRLDGTVFDVEVTASVCVHDGRPAYQVVIRDITERIRAQRDLQESEERYRVLVEATRVVPWEADPQTYRFLYVAPQVVELLGYPRQAWYEKDFWIDGLHPEDRETAVAYCKEHQQLGAPYEFEYRFRQADGNFLWIRDYVSVKMDGQGRVDKLWGVFVDVTGMRRAEECLRQREAELAHAWRLNTMNELGTGLAHEISQPLASLVTHAQFALRVLGSTPAPLSEVQSSLESIVEHGLRAGEVVHRLQDFVRLGEPEKQPVHLSEVIGSVLRFDAPFLSRDGIHVATQVGADLPAVHASRIQMEQVLLNLITNARQGLRECGQAEKRVWIGAERTTPHEITVMVRDNGPGLSDLECQKVFEPFYSTKPNGLGLGLAISRSLVEAHGGRMWASSGAEGGATFQFTIPVASSE